MSAAAIKTAKGLPEACFAVIPGKDVLIVIARGCSATGSRRRNRATG